MALDLQVLGSKLRRYRDQSQLSVEEVADATGVPAGRVVEFENGEISPNGDEVLIFLTSTNATTNFSSPMRNWHPSSKQKISIDDTAENFGRRTGVAYRSFYSYAIASSFWLKSSVQFDSVCPTLLRKALTTKPMRSAAVEIRRLLGYRSTEIPRDVYADFRMIGCHVFRRRLTNSNISGLCVRHPVAGPCILVNYSEDLFRQRFSAAHEAAHALLDDDDVIVSFQEWSTLDLREVRAKTFASRFLFAPEFLTQIPGPNYWNDVKAVEWARKLNVSTEALSIALLRSRPYRRGNSAIDQASARFARPEVRPRATREPLSQVAPAKKLSSDWPF